MDVFNRDKRSRIMSAIRGKNTAPELLVRKALRTFGCRYTLHSNKLPGIPDVVLPERKTAVFIHGCFWHQHKSCRRCSVPKTNRRYWVPKLKRNVERFTEVQKELRKMGWKILVVWECQTKNSEALSRLLVKKLRA